MRDASFYLHPVVGHLPEAEHAPRRFWVAEVPIELVVDNGTATSAEAVQVYANHGRWIAECPDCRGAQLASRTDPRFMCNNCANAGIGGLWRPLVWPKDHGKIEALLSVRPVAETRNWAPGERLRDLKAENVGMLEMGD